MACGQSRRPAAAPLDARQRRGRRLLRMRSPLPVRRDGVEVVLNGLPDRRQLYGHQEMTAAREADEARIRDGADGELGVVEQLQSVVLGMDDEGGRPDRRDPRVRERGPVVERGSGGTRGGRVHGVDDLVDQCALLRGEGADDGVVGAHQRGQAPSEQPGDRPVQRVVLEERCQRRALAVCRRLGGLRRRRDPARDQRERRDTLGVQGGEEQCGWAAVRQGDDGGLPHPEVVEEPGVGVRLLVEGGALAEGRAQVAEAGGCDPAVAVAEQRPRDELTLIVAAAAPVDHEHGRARPARGVLDVAVG